MSKPTPKQPWRPRFGWSFWVVAPLVAFVLIGSVAGGGLSSLLIGVGVVALLTGLYSLATGRASWASVPGRKAAAIVLVASIVSMGAGGALAPKQADDTSPLANQQEFAPTKTTSSPTPKLTKNPYGFTDESAPDPEKVTVPKEPVSVAIADSSVTRTTALALLATLPIKGKSPMTGYERTAKFGSAWLDVDRNGCDTRNDILARDFVDASKSGVCKVVRGQLVSPYTGVSIDFVRGNKTSMAVQIDHVVALGNAWQTGAQKLNQAERIALANDPINLFAVDGKSNAQKGAGDTATWLPSAKSFRCTYVAHQVSVKATYGLWVTQPEHDAMSRVLSSCGDQPAVTSSFAPAPKPVAVPVPVPAPVVAPAPAPSSCDPNYSGQCVPIASDVDCAGGSGNGPAYTPGPVRVIGSDVYDLDRDGDKIACD